MNRYSLLFSLASALSLFSCMEESDTLTQASEVIITRQDTPLPSKPTSPTEPPLPPIGTIRVSALSVLSQGADSLLWETGNFSIISDPSFKNQKTVYSPNVYTLYLNRQTNRPGNQFIGLEQLSFTYRNPQVGSSDSSGGMVFITYMVVTKNRSGGIVYTDQSFQSEGYVELADYDETLHYLKGLFDFKVRIQLTGEKSSRQLHFRSDTLKLNF